MKIYVVTKGSYSDYHIITATTDKELAERIREKFTLPNSWDEAYVEEYEDAELFLRPVWFVRFNKDGTVNELSARNDCEYEYENLNQCRRDINGRVFVSVVSDTADGAIKIAAEKRAEFLAMESGIA